MNAFIVDDEKPAREELQWLLEQCNEVTVIGEAENADGARATLSGLDETVDVVFLDIDMPGIDGIQFAEFLAEMSPEPLTVFVTAYEEYALDAFGVAAVDYLLKPVRLERLRSAVERVRQRLESRDSSQDDSRPPLTRISVKSGEGFRVIDTEEILFFESQSGDVSVTTTHGRFPTDFSLKFLEAKLDGEEFFRCHRSYIVRVDAIEEIVPAGAGTYRLYLAGEGEDGGRPSAPLARSRAKEFKNRIPWSASVVDP